MTESNHKMKTPPPPPPLPPVPDYVLNRPAVVKPVVFFDNSSDMNELGFLDLRPKYVDPDAPKDPSQETGSFAEDLSAVDFTEMEALTEEQLRILEESETSKQTSSS